MDYFASLGVETDHGFDGEDRSVTCSLELKTDEAHAGVRISRGEAIDSADRWAFPPMASRFDSRNGAL